MTEYEAYRTGQAPCQLSFAESKEDMENDHLDGIGQDHYICEVIELHCLITKEMPAKWLPRHLVQACAEHCRKYQITMTDVEGRIAYEHRQLGPEGVAWP